MKRRLLCILLTVCCLASFLTMGANADYANPFVDITDESAYYYDPVLWAYEFGITTGTDATHFTPGKTCTRAEVVTFLWRLVDKPTPETTENPFRDVSRDSWYYDAVLWASETGITTGTGDGGFSPDRTVTRSEFVTFLWRLDGKNVPEETSPFSDVTDPAAFYYHAVIWANSLGITSGTGDGKFSPTNPCSRGETVTFLYRYILSFPILLDDGHYMVSIDSLEQIDGVWYSDLVVVSPAVYEAADVESIKIGDTFHFGETLVYVWAVQIYEYRDIIINNQYCFEKRIGSNGQPYYYLYSTEGYIMEAIDFGYHPWRDGAHVMVPEQNNAINLNWYHDSYYPTYSLMDVQILNGLISGGWYPSYMPDVR